MRLAIGVPYAIDQNEPSEPIRQIIELPDEEGNREVLLRHLFNDHVLELEDDQTITVTECVPGGDYGDLVVTLDDDDGYGVVLYITYIDPEHYTA